MAETLIEIGKITNTHGLRGEVKIVPWLDYPEVFEAFTYIYLSDGTRLDVAGVKYQKSNIIARFKGLNNISDVEKFKNQIIYVEKSCFDNLPEGTYLIADIIGLKAIDDTTEYGTITDVFSTGSNDVYVIESKGRKPILVPVIDGVVEKVDLESGIIKLNIPDGILDL